MKASVLIYLGILFFLLVPLGIYAKIFLMYGIGLTGAGLSFVLFSISNGKEFKRFQGIQYRLVLLGLGLLTLYGSSGFWLDLPLYVNKNYSHLEGIPQKITYEEPSKGELEGTIIVTIHNKRLPLDPSPKYPIEHMKGHRLEIYYLPHTEWIINYKIE